MSTEVVESHAVHVVVRVRPNKTQDEEEAESRVLTYTNNSVSTHLTHTSTTFNLSSVRDQSTTQIQFFDDEIKPHLDKLTPGINLTFFCYGITGAGM